MNDAFTKDIAKAVSNTQIRQELPAGATPRRWEPEGGVKKLNERIHRESKYADTHKNLPFSFSKPKKEGRQKVAQCDDCGHTKYVGINCVGVICSKCNKYVSVTEV